MYVNVCNSIAHKTPQMEITKKTISCLMEMYTLLFLSFAIYLNTVCARLYFQRQLQKSLHFKCPSQNMTLASLPYTDAFCKFFA